MSHELDVNKANGKRAMFSVGETPWHEEGEILTSAPTLADALTLGGLDWQVELRPLFTLTSGLEPGKGAGLHVPGKAVVRTDRNIALAAVGDSYRPLQNYDAFRVLEPLLDRGVATLETGGSLRGGRDVWMMVRFQIDDPVVREVFADETIPFGMITNNHAGNRAITLMETPVRVVCANTLGMAFMNRRSRMLTVPHIDNARVKLVEAAEQMFGSLIERYRLIAEDYRLMKATILEVEDFVQSVLDVAAPLPTPPTRDHKPSWVSYNSAVTTATKKRDAIKTAWDAGKGHSGDHSAWEAYNGAVEVIDHQSDLFRVPGSRVQSLMDGSLGQRKLEVLTSVLELCKR